MRSDFFEGPMRRRELLQGGAGLALALGLAGCGVGEGGDSTSTTKKAAPVKSIAAKPDGDLVYFNWSEYLDPQLIKDFEKQYGVKVRESNFDSMNGMMSKLRSGNRYDVIFPTADWAQRLIRGNQLLRFDKEQLKNSDAVYDYFSKPWYDEGADHTVPYALYASGIIYRTDKVKPTGSWNDLGLDSAKGRIYMLDDYQEVLGAGAMATGSDLNTKNQAEVDKAKQWALDLKPKLRGYSTDDIQNMVGGNAWIHHGWNGDVVNIRNQVKKADNYSFQKCTEGIPLGHGLHGDPGQRRAPRHGADVHQLHPRAGERRPQHRVHGLPDAVHGPGRDLRRARQGRPGDQRDDRGPRERRPVPRPRRRRAPHVGRGLDGDQSGVKDDADRFAGRFLIPGGLWLLLFFAVPFFVVVALSFGTPGDLGGAVYGWYPENYSRAFDPVFLPVLARSVGYALVTVALCLLLGYPVAYYIARFGGRHKNVLIALVVLPFFVNYLVRTYAWVALLSDEGVVNGVLGLDDPIRFLNTPYAVVGGLVYGYLAFMILPVYAALDRMDPALIEAGKDLYGSNWSTFWHVTWPTTLQGVLAGTVLVFLPAVGDFVSAQLLGGPGTYMIGNLIQQQFFGAENWPFGAALTVLLMAFLFVWMVLYLRSAARASREVAT